MQEAHLLRSGFGPGLCEVSGCTLGGRGLVWIQNRSGARGLCSDLSAFVLCLQNAPAA